MAYIKRNFVNSPLTTTPLNATNLNVMDTAIYNNDISTNTGWNLITATLTYASADAPSFVANTSVDLTTILMIGMKIKLTQTTVKYFIITAITSTTITLYGGTDYTLVNAVITLPYFSIVKSPFGFPINPDKWTETFTSTSDVNTGSVALSTTITNFTGISKAIPIGSFRLYFNCFGEVGHAGVTNNRQCIGLSTTNNSFSNTSLIDCGSSVSTSTTLQSGKFNAETNILNTVKTTYYLNTRSINNNSTQYLAGTVTPTVIKAICNYL